MNGAFCVITQFFFINLDVTVTAYFFALMCEDIKY